jgi:hypothetical protein
MRVIRPCPGLNAAAKHEFLARDGLTTFDVSLGRKIKGVYTYKDDFTGTRCRSRKHVHVSYGPIPSLSSSL